MAVIFFGSIFQGSTQTAQSLDRLVIENSKLGTSGAARNSKRLAF